MPLVEGSSFSPAPEFLKLKGGILEPDCSIWLWSAQGWAAYYGKCRRFIRLEARPQEMNKHMKIAHVKYARGVQQCDKASWRRWISSSGGQIGRASIAPHRYTTQKSARIGSILCYILILWLLSCVDSAAVLPLTRKRRPQRISGKGNQGRKQMMGLHLNPSARRMKAVMMLWPSTCLHHTQQKHLLTDDGTVSY